MADKVAETPVPGYENINLTVSVGGVLSEGRTVEEAVRQADGSCTRRKGRKNLVITDSDDLDSYEFHKPLLLLVDDSEMNRVILSEMLKDQYEILEADCGESGHRVPETAWKRHLHRAARHRHAPVLTASTCSPSCRATAGSTA